MRFRFAITVSFAALVAAACGGSPTAPTQPANLVAEGNLSVQGCQIYSVTGLFSCGYFSGVIRNGGTGCAANVRGTTGTFRTSDRAQIGSAGWSYTAKVRPGEIITYSGGPILVTQSGTWAYDTAPSWDNVPC